MSLIRRITEKLFNLDPEIHTCSTCEVLQIQLDNALEREKELIERLLDLTKPAIIPTEPVRTVGDPFAKTKSFRAAIKERELQDHLSAQKMREINKLEEELKISQALESEDAQESNTAV